MTRRLSRFEFVALMAGLGTINAAAIDVMLPALPHMGAFFGVANPNDRSLVLTAFMLGLGLPQLVFGPVIDRLGRRGPLLAGVALYAAAALLAPLAPNFTALLVLRFVQGMGSAAVQVASQSTVRDLYAGRDMARIMSLIMSVFMIVPIVAPNVGQIVLLTAPWQGIFVFMGLVGITFGIWAYLRLDETLAPENRRALTVSSITEGFGIVFGNRSALFYGLAGIFLFGAVLGFVNTAQQVYVGIYGLGALFPVMFSVGPIAFAVAFILNARLVGRLGMRRLAHGAILIYLVVTALWALLAWAGAMPLWAFATFLAAATLMQGFAWGNVGSLSMEPLGEVAGTAAAVFGTFSTVGAAIIGYIVAQSFNGTTTPVATSYFVLGLLVVACFLIAERGRLLQPHTGEAAPAPPA